MGGIQTPLSLRIRRIFVQWLTIIFSLERHGPKDWEHRYKAEVPPTIPVAIKEGYQTYCVAQGWYKMRKNYGQHYFGETNNPRERIQSVQRAGQVYDGWWQGRKPNP